MIPLSILDEEISERLRISSEDFHISSGGLFVREAWVFEEPNLYREKILIEKELLEWLVRFFNTLSDSDLSTTSLQASIANLLEALIGEKLSETFELQELLEKRLGIHFTTNLLSFELERLSALRPDEKNRLQEDIREATRHLADFLDMNTRRLSKEPRVWMPVIYLP